ncbi:hypothetical protein [Dokdonella sp.]|uniref:hypothetical protein n=1 Tax=Dokdonella sp. TaxID=2291710 RepID=UPI003C49D437
MSPLTVELASHYVHVRVLLGMVVGLGLTHLIRNFARIIDRPVRLKAYWIHLLWAISMFIYLLHFWWWEFRLSHTVEWTFEIYLFVTVYALLLYLLCTILFPDVLEEGKDYRSLFYDRRAWFFGLLALAYMVDFVDTLIKGEAYFRATGSEYIVRNLGYVAMCGVAIATRNPVFHGFFACVGLAYQVSWIIRQFQTLN